MSRQELADAVNAWLAERRHWAGTCSDSYIGKLERGQHRWPYDHYRSALCGVLNASETELGFFRIHGHASDHHPRSDVRADVREPVRLPAGFWQRPDVLTALERCDIGGLFRCVRQYAGASQTRIGFAVGMTQGTVSEIMSLGPRQRRVTTHTVLTRVADGLDMPDDARILLGLAARPPEPAAADVAASRSPDRPDTTVGGAADTATGQLMTAVGSQDSGPARVSVDPGAAVTVDCRDGAQATVTVSAGGVLHILIGPATGSGHAQPVAPWPRPPHPPVRGGDARIFPFPAPVDATAHTAST